MPIVFQEPKPYELWSPKEPTAIAVDGEIRVTLTVCAAPPPQPATETQVVLYLELEDARHLRSQTEVAIGRACVQLKNQP